MGLVKNFVVVAFLAWLLVRLIMINKILSIHQDACFAVPVHQINVFLQQFEMISDLEMNLMELRYSLSHPVYVMGFGVPVFNHVPGPCKMFYVNGSEDIEVLPNGLALFSSGLKFELNVRRADTTMFKRQGIIYAFNLNKPEEKPNPVRLENFNDSDFVPHGIDLYTDPNTQEMLLFVVNHGEGKHSIEIFQFDQENVVLKHKRTVVDDKIYSPNDVVAVGPDSFYITNDRYFKNKFMGFIDAFYPLKLSNVVFYDGAQAKFVADHLHFGNGINADASRKYIFVVSGMAGEVIVYERTGENDLIKRQIIDTGIILDNVEVDENGDLWLGVANFAFLDHSTDFSKPCPGQVLHVKLTKEENGVVPFKVKDIREVFASSGVGDFKCVSSASFHRGKLLIGNPFSNLMYCEVVVA